MERSQERNGGEGVAGREPGGEGLRLRREIGLWSAVSLMAGCMIGSGVFMSPQGVLVYMGSPGASLMVWAGCGLLAMMGALCYAELSALVPKSGGEYAYILQIFGSLPAFLVIYTFVLLVRPAAIAAVSLSFAEYAVTPFYPGCSSMPQAVLKGVAASCILLLTLVNCWSSRLATMLVNVCAVAKVFSLLVIVVGGAVVLGQGRGHTETFLLAFHNTTQQAGRIGMAFYQGMWSFDGWNNVNYVVEELKNPKEPGAGGLGLAGTVGCRTLDIWLCQWDVLRWKSRVLCGCERRPHAPTSVHGSCASPHTKSGPDVYHGSGFGPGHPRKLQHHRELLELPWLDHLWNHHWLSLVLADKEEESSSTLQGPCVHCRSPPSSLSSCSLLLSTWCWRPSSTTPRLSSCTSSCSCSVASRSISCLSISTASPGVCRWPPCISSCSWKLLQPLKMLTKGLDSCALPSLLQTPLSPHKWPCEFLCRLTLHNFNEQLEC
ncbi:large neutral amino acids transporter small subunit 1-like isoform X4 [Panthera pardus]|uniref:Large neutral amino acids transporter small subunit 1-like isoform X4 n=1 Tax=Panthera pardus TaxID=9691 RepID=A0A9V1FP54_PANPR|nr:large neutral amino acids transporter small subunit 1-like isoform X4 [Panthera pardus]